MARHIAITPGTLYPQPGYTLAVDREGKWTARQVYLCHRDSVVSLMPRPGAPHPEIPFITLDNAQAEVGEGEIATITCHYAGTDNTGDTATRTSYSAVLSLSEEPLLAHRKFRELDAVELEALQALIAGKEKDSGGASYKDMVTSPLGKKALEKIQRGQVSYYSPRVAWRQATVRKISALASDMRSIGLIDEPDGRQPGLPEGRNWLYNGATQSQEGSAFRIEREWIASDAGGWDEDLYQE